MTDMEKRRALAQEREEIKAWVKDEGGDMARIVFAIINLAEEVTNLAADMELREGRRVQRREEAARLEVDETSRMETPYPAIPETAYLAIPPNNPAWRESLRSLLENARPAVEAMKDGRTLDYMLNPVAMIAFFDGLEEALRATAADKNWRSLPEYSLSLPTWQMAEDGELIGVKKWKRLWTKPDGGNFWIIGEAFMFPKSKRVHILWSMPE